MKMSIAIVAVSAVLTFGLASPAFADTTYGPFNGGGPAPMTAPATPVFNGGGPAPMTIPVHYHRTPKLGVVIPVFVPVVWDGSQVVAQSQIRNGTVV